ncbi:tyrosine-type recombinase/integrase [Novosphingobium sp.]|uniref:tyrosine-type recombinase/integrase n=1 Tax=Novosphingobium sp. TaxID=1874826 RepID=UPI0038BAC2BE
MSLGTQLFDEAGRRKYLSNDELARFIRTAQAAPPQVRAFCLLLAHAGCRISEALAITPQHLDQENQRVIFRTLKRRRTVFRAVPIPDALMRQLSRLASGAEDNALLWPWARQTAWRKVKVMMDRAGVEGVMASPKGLRHAYGIKAAASNVPQNLIQRWLGHAKPDTTLIYVDAVGVEERSFAKRMW